MTARALLDSLLLYLDGPAVRLGAPRRDLARFDLGVCPGCRGLRAVASVLCETCRSEAPVTADA